jgi:3-isopropylmalate/(R)-2-methylmalate dehydratase small subunit
MEPIRILSGRGVPLDRSDVDTDQIIPSEWLKRVERTGFGRGLFSEWRDDTSFILNQPDFYGARILVAGPRFGTGSSREHAVWALMDYGFAAIIAPSFGDIFRNNSSKQGLVIVTLNEQECERLSNILHTTPHVELTIDIERGLVEAPEVGFVAHFEMDPITRERLVNGWDDIGLTLLHEERIAAHESRLGQTQVDTLRQHLT